MPFRQLGPAPRWAATLRRSVRLFAAFRHEQDDPDRFYSALAADSVGQLSGYLDLPGRTVLDVGGGPGYFREAFRAAGATYVALDADVGELSGLGEIAAGTVIGDGMRLPFRDDAVDLTYSSNVLEHVRIPGGWPRRCCGSPGRAGSPSCPTPCGTDPGGGHETAPWHFLGGGRARRRYRRRHGREPKNRFGESLFAVTVRDGLDWAARQQSATVLDILPRYHPRWSYALLRVPGLREVLTWNLVIVLRKR